MWHSFRVYIVLITQQELKKPALMEAKVQAKAEMKKMRSQHYLSAHTAD
jgi:hypothetical protein